MPPLGVALVAMGAVLALLGLSRANELCAVQVRDGTARLVRGRAPPRFLEDVDDIVRRAGLHRVIIRVVSERGSPRLVASKGVPDDVVQRLRNAAGQHRIVHFRTGRRAS